MLKVELILLVQILKSYPCLSAKIIVFKTLYVQQFYPAPIGAIQNNTSRACMISRTKWTMYSYGVCRVLMFSSSLILIPHHVTQYFARHCFKVVLF